MLICLISLLISPVFSTTAETLSLHEFELFKQKFNKEYSDEVSPHRYSVFQKNLEYITSVNSQDLGFKLAVGPFADLTYEEFSSQYLKSSRLSASDEFNQHIEILDTTSTPVSVNWLQAGKVSGPKDQGKCAAYYIFSSIASIESAWAIAHEKNDEVLNLSEQQVLDCAGYSGQGCNGGYGYEVYDYLMQAKCITSEDKYKYAKKEGKCSSMKMMFGCTDVKVKGWKAVTPNNEVQLMAAVALQPVDSSVYASRSMQHYAYGVIPTGWCSEGEYANHEVLLIGYQQVNGIDFWIGKNSWGRQWGLSGFFLIERNANNVESPGACLVASESVYPIIG